MDKLEKKGEYQRAIFAGGCFWCMVASFQELPGVLKVVSGYIGGHLENPTYDAVCAGGTGHYEAVEVTYDPDLVSYEKLVNVFWRQINPIDPGGQFFDRGESYRTAIFVSNEEQKKIAEASKRSLENSGRFQEPISTKILPAAEFYPAEGYHQDYHKKNEKHYKLYRTGSGRDDFIEQYWNK